MVFVTTMALLAALYQLSSLYTDGRYVLVAIDIVIIITAIFVMLEAASALMRERRAAAAGVGLGFPFQGRHEPFAIRRRPGAAGPGSGRCSASSTRPPTGARWPARAATRTTCSCCSSSRS